MLLGSRLSRSLSRVFFDHSGVDVVVELIDADEAVTVEIGLAALEASYQMTGKNREPSCPGDPDVLPGELRRVAGGQHETSEAVASKGSRWVGSWPLGAVLEGTAVTAIQDQDLSPRATVVHFFRDEGGRDGST